MPIYEYRCGACSKKSDIFFRSVSTVREPVCPTCGSSEMNRLVSRFAVLKSAESRLEAMDDPSAFGDLDENDPRSVARWARRMGSEMGEDMPPEFQEMVEKMEAGEIPDDIDASDLGGFGGPMGGIGGASGDYSMFDDE